MRISRLHCIREFRTASCKSRHSPKSPDAPKGLRAFCFWCATLCRCRSRDRVRSAYLMRCCIALLAQLAESMCRRYSVAHQSKSLFNNQQSQYVPVQRCMGTHADIVQLVERDLAKVEVAGSRPAVRSNLKRLHLARALRVELVFSVCRLARSKSSALGAENRRFKSCHTDQMGIGRDGRRMSTRIV